MSAPLSYYKLDGAYKYYIKTPTKEISEKIQLFVFKYGFEWCGTGPGLWFPNSYIDRGISFSFGMKTIANISPSDFGEIENMAKINFNELARLLDDDIQLELELEFA